MAWISYADICALYLSVPTNAEILDALQDWGAYIVLEKGTVQQTAFEDAGVILRQPVQTTRAAYVGLDRDLAERVAAALAADTVAKTYYYKAQTSSSNLLDVLVAERLSGSRTEAVARRRNDADGWETSVVVTSYPATTWSGWSTSVPSSASNGIEVARSSSRTFIFNYAGNVLYQTESTVVTEYRFVAAGNVASMVSNNTADASWIQKEKTVSGVKVSRYVRDGVQKTASARYIDSARLWTVTVTATTYGNTGW